MKEVQVEEQIHENGGNTRSAPVAPDSADHMGGAHRAALMREQNPDRPATQTLRQPQQRMPLRALPLRQTGAA